MSFPFLETDASVESTGVTQLNTARIAPPVDSPAVPEAATPTLHQSVVDLGKQTTD